MYWIAMIVLILGTVAIELHHQCIGGILCGLALGLAYTAGLREAE
jgi:NhaP-type Na+/H+ or K+/H+ antiporter